MRKSKELTYGTTLQPLQMWTASQTSQVPPEGILLVKDFHSFTRKIKRCEGFYITTLAHCRFLDVLSKPMEYTQVETCSSILNHLTGDSLRGSPGTGKTAISMCTLYS
ncbi:uncharacterized protein EI90DRAFT_316735 [Cantharellus anzutake]|uniref:uncharacterized protein n=1 Tax=Cantharellus anzutake TaxID=1750568 RepID=UPI001906EA56|nr:uncharacterized protein EI90DRAFT_316735 [Cantharellus anzutake]KAF8335327.1 hypothetical protein EI90DRAFT_316735 [Cantharellus anzutake]